MILFVQSLRFQARTTHAEQRVQDLDEEINNLREKHRVEINELRSNYEKDIKESRNEHDRTLRELDRLREDLVRAQHDATTMEQQRFYFSTFCNFCMQNMSRSDFNLTSVNQIIISSKLVITLLHFFQSWC